MNVKYNENHMLKLFLLGFLRDLFSDLFNQKIESNLYKFSIGNYEMDNQIIQHIIKDILETGDYTMEGIAYYTKVPFDVVCDAASGIHNQLSITSWASIVNLYLQVKPDISQMLVDRLIEIKEKNYSAYHLLLN
jgi:hypothetical protein